MMMMQQQHHHQSSAAFRPSAAPSSLNAIHLQQQQHMLMMGMAGASSSASSPAMMMAFQQQQHHHMAAASGHRQQHHHHHSGMGMGMGNHHTTHTMRSTRSPNNASSAANASGGGAVRQPSTPFNPAAAMPLEDMIVAYNGVKAREIEMQADYANEVAASLAAIPPFVSPFVDYACSQQGKLVLQGLLHFEDEVAVAQDLFLSIGGSIEHIALNEHGCHVIRALGEKIGFAAAVIENEDGTINVEAAAAQNESSLIAFIASLHETLFLNVCTLSQESRRIPQALFETYNATRPELFTSLVDIVARNVLYLSATQQGCIALIRIYEASNFAQKRQMAANLVRIIADLSCDSFGNYVVQCLVEHSEVHVAAQYISSAFVGQCVRLACNKFASNVLEKSIRKLSHIPSVRKVILDELVFDPANVTLCCEDSYANFVVQTLIETCSNAAEYRKVHDRVKGAIANSMYAVKIEARLRSKSFFASAAAAAAASSPSIASSSVVGPQQQQNVSVTVGSSGNNNNNSNSSSGNSAVMQALMTAATAAAIQLRQQQQQTSAFSSSAPSPLSATLVSAAAGPVYNANTAPSTPMAGAVETTSSAFNNNNNNNNNKKHSANNTNAAAAALPTHAAIVAGHPRRTMHSHDNNKSRQHHHGNNNNTNTNNNNNNNKENGHHAAAPQKGNGAYAPAKHDPLRAEAKQLLNSDQPPTRFTPYKPSPFHDRSNRQNNANNRQQQDTHLKAPATSASSPAAAVCEKSASPSSPSSKKNLYKEKDASSSPAPAHHHKEKGTKKEARAGSNGSSGSNNNSAPRRNANNNRNNNGGENFHVPRRNNGVETVCH